MNRAGDRVGWKIGGRGQLHDRIRPVPAVERLRRDRDRRAQRGQHQVDVRRKGLRRLGVGTSHHHVAADRPDVAHLQVGDVEEVRAKGHEPLGRSRRVGGDEPVQLVDDVRERLRRADVHAGVVGAESQQLVEPRDVDQHMRVVGRRLEDADRRVAGHELEVRRAAAVRGLQPLGFGERGRVEPRVAAARPFAGRRPVGLQLLRKRERRRRARQVLLDRDARPAGMVGVVLVVLLEIDGEAAHAFEDRTESRAPADVAVEEVFDLLLGRLGMRPEEREHVHHEAGRAVAALRAVEGGDPELHGIERLASRPDALGRRDDGAVQRDEWTQAGVDGRVLDALPGGVPARQHHRARAAAALAAGELGAGEADRVVAEPVDEQRRRIGMLEGHAAAVDVEEQRARGHVVSSPC